MSGRQWPFLRNGQLQGFITICNPFHVNESVTDKESILDIKAEDESHRTYNIEMQLQGNSIFSNRALYYWAKAYASQLSKGESYKRFIG